MKLVEELTTVAPGVDTVAAAGLLSTPMNALVFAAAVVFFLMFLAAATLAYRYRRLVTEKEEATQPQRSASYAQMVAPLQEQA